MGRRAYSYLCAGIKFESDYTFPWDGEEFSGDIENWWRNVKGYAPEARETWDTRKAWLEDNPIPVELIMIGTDEEPSIMLCVPGTVVECDWIDHAVTVDDEWNVCHWTKIENFLSFFEEFKIGEEIDIREETRYYLCTYYG